MSISISRKQSVNELFLQKIQDYKLEKHEHMFLDVVFIHGFSMLFNAQNKRYSEAIKVKDSEDSKNLFKKLNKYKIKPNGLVRKTEIKNELFKDKKIWSNEDKIYQHIILHLDNEIITLPGSKNKAYLWGMYTASTRGGNDTLWYVLSFKPEDYQEVETFLNLLRKFNDSFHVSAKTLHCTGTHDIHLTGNYTWDDLVLPDRIIKSIKDDLEFWIKSEDLYKKNRLIYHRAYLMCGPPGNGKTATARVILSMYDFTGYMFSFTNKRLDDSDLINMFEEAKQRAPSLILLEDLDKSFDRTSFCNVSLECLLNCLDGISTNEGIVVIATANNPQLLDPSIRHRPGRFDVVVEFNNPDYDQRKQYLKKLFGVDAQISDTILNQVIGETEGMSMAFVKLVYETAGSRAFKRSSNGSFLIKDEDLLESLDMCLSYYEKSRTGKERKAGFKPKKKVEDKRRRLRNRLTTNAKTKDGAAPPLKIGKEIKAPFNNDWEAPFKPYEAEPCSDDDNQPPDPDD